MKLNFNVLIIAAVTITCRSYVKAVTVERVTGTFGLTEGPHWDIDGKKLYFVDIFANTINCLDTTTGEVNSAYIKNGPVGMVAPIENSPGRFIAGSGRDIILVSWDGVSNSTNPPIEKVASVDQDRNDTRCNDGKIDSTGRLWIGTMGPEDNGIVTPNRGSLYSIESDFHPKKHISSVSISNGLAWTNDDDVMYYIDSPTRQIVAYDFDAKNPTIANKKIVFDLNNTDVEGLPDGMTIDMNGNLWVALHAGGRVIQVDPKDGKIVTSVEIPAKRVTSVAFGGPQLDALYVTTSSYGLTKSEKEQQPLAGALFVVKGLGVIGRPSNAFKLHK